MLQLSFYCILIDFSFTLGPFWVSKLLVGHQRETELLLLLLLRLRAWAPLLNTEAENCNKNRIIARLSRSISPFVLFLSFLELLENFKCTLTPLSVQVDLSYLELF